MSKSIPLARAAAASAAMLLALGLAPAAFAKQDASAQASKNVLRVCASSEEAPYSTGNETGFENKIAKIVADEMGRKAEFVWLDKPAIYLVRDLLDKNKCDVVIGLDDGDPRVATTNAYYRAPYVFITRKDSDLDITSFKSPDIMKTDKVGYDTGSPAEVMMKQIGLYNRNFNYQRSLTNFKSRRNQYVRIQPSQFVTDVADGKADLAIAFAPEVARFAKDNGKVKLTVVPDNNFRSDGEHVPFHFDQSMGVRKDDTALLKELNQALEKAEPQIIGVLKEEGIPVLEVTKKEASR